MAESPLSHNQSRAVLRFIEPGSGAMCAHCDEPVKFKARIKAQQVICNVYVDGRWNRVEHFHADCYDTAGLPYGVPVVGSPHRASVEGRSLKPQSASPAA